MAYVLKNIGRATNMPYYTFECDDVEDLPLIDISEAIMGSRCYVINTGASYALNSKKEWKIIPTSSGEGGDSGGSGGSGSEGDLIYEGGMEV